MSLEMLVEWWITLQFLAVYRKRGWVEYCYKAGNGMMRLEGQNLFYISVSVLLP